MARLNFHPAPGLGELIAGSWSVPQNPLRMGMGSASYKPRLGDLLPGKFVVPQNPLRAALTSESVINPQNSGTGMSGLGCGGNCGGCSGCGGGMSGLGDFDIASFTGGLSLPVIGIAAAAAYLLFFSGGASARRSALSDAEKEYRDKRKAIKSEYSVRKRLTSL